MSTRTSRLSFVRPASNALPPWALTVVAIVTVQLGAAIAKSLFDVAGSSGVVFLRTFIGALVFLMIVRPHLRGYTRRTYGFLALYGATITFNMLTFYAAIDRIPLGVTVAISFGGPLALAVMGSRRASDLIWVVLAVAGILLLSPITDATLDPVGVLLAFACAVAWAAYVLLTKRAGNVMAGNTALALATCAAAIFAAPFGAHQAAAVLASPTLIGVAILVALMTLVIPVWLEFAALKRLSSRVFGLLMSLEPVAATLIGWIILHETLGIVQIAGIAMVTIAAAATTRSEH
ncbi:MAG: EamA family transporter [Anaerolineae bacterium]|nr:EamA family transporter [Anaerolineae bacterium]